MSGPPNKILLLGVLGGALVLGGATGSMVIAPKIISARSAKHATAPAHADEKKQSPEAKGVIYQIENIIVNPAGTQGIHFLMITVAFEVPDPKSEAAMRENDVRIRDKVIETLESESMEMLTAPGARDTLKRDLAAAVKPFAGNARWMKVYLPQFVIQ